MKFKIINRANFYEDPFLIEVLEWVVLIEIEILYPKLEKYQINTWHNGSSDDLSLSIFLYCIFIWSLQKISKSTLIRVLRLLLYAAEGNVFPQFCNNLLPRTLTMHWPVYRSQTLYLYGHKSQKKNVVADGVFSCWSFCSFLFSLIDYFNEIHSCFTSYIPSHFTICVQSGMCLITWTTLVT